MRVRIGWRWRGIGGWRGIGWTGRRGILRSRGRFQDRWEERSRMQGCLLLLRGRGWRLRRRKLSRAGMRRRRRCLRVPDRPSILLPMRMRGRESGTWRMKGVVSMAVASWMSVTSHHSRKVSVSSFTLSTYLLICPAHRVQPIRAKAKRGEEQR